MTQRFLSGDFDPDTAEEAAERFSDRSKHAEADRITKTAALRDTEAHQGDLDALPLGEVMQVYSLFSEVFAGGTIYRCVVRKTLNRLAPTQLVVGDRVRFTTVDNTDGAGTANEAVIERVEPRRTLLTRSDSFKQQAQHPIVANAGQMLIVAAIKQPNVKWGLIDRMLVAATAGGLTPIVVLNKIDLIPLTDPAPGRRADDDDDDDDEEPDDDPDGGNLEYESADDNAPDDSSADEATGQARNPAKPDAPANEKDAPNATANPPAHDTTTQQHHDTTTKHLNHKTTRPRPQKSPESDLALAREVLAHYRTLGITTIETSVTHNVGLGALRDLLRDHVTVLAGHSGVGKSSLICAIQPQLDLRVAAVSGFNDKGRHTTTGARTYPLDFGGSVIDTPGVKLFGLWNVTPDNLDDFFPDIAAHTAPPWRIDSYDRIRQSLDTGRR